MKGCHICWKNVENGKSAEVDSIVGEMLKYGYDIWTYVYGFFLYIDDAVLAET